MGNIRWISRQTHQNTNHLNLYSVGYITNNYVSTGMGYNYYNMKIRGVYYIMVTGNTVSQA